MIEQLEAIETILPVSIEIEETFGGDIMFDIEPPHGIIAKRESDN
jgi:hypothetical protein